MSSPAVPLISVLTPSLNSGQYLTRAVESVLEQNDPNFEHIVMDAVSTDNTVEILKKYDHLIWRSEPDKGQSDAMNKAMAEAKGEIIVFLNADDFFMPGAFAAIRAEFNRDPKLAMVVGNLYHIQTNEEWNYCGYELIDSEILYKRILLFFRYRFPINPVAYFYRREVMLKVGDFPLSNRYSMDFWFLLRAYKRFQKRISKIDTVLGCFYSYETNKTSVINPFLQCHGEVMDHIKTFNPAAFFWYYPRYLLLKYRPVFSRIKARIKSVIKSILPGFMLRLIRTLRSH